jgi:hypothetical protein
VKALETALYTLLTGDTTLMALLPGGVHNTLANAPTGTYLVFQKVANSPVGYTYRLLEGETYLYQFRFIVKGFSKGGILDALARLRVLLNLATLTVTGRTVWRTTWDADMPDMSELDSDGVPFLQVGATYRIEIGA